MDDQIEKVIRHVHKTICATRLSNANSDSAFPYAAVPLCIIDAIFSIQWKYEYVWRFVGTWAKRHRWELCRWRAQQNGEQHTTSDFLNLMEPYGDRFSEIAEHEFTHHKIPAGKPTEILKAEAVIRFARVFQDFGIETLDEALEKGRRSKVRNEIEKIPGHGPGVIYNYVLMLVGWPEAVKADTRVTQFVADALRRRAPTTPQLAETLVREAAHRLKEEFPNLTPSLLDNEIWRKVSGQGRHEEPWVQAARECAKYRPR